MSCQKARLIQWLRNDAAVTHLGKEGDFGVLWVAQWPCLYLFLDRILKWP